MRCHYEALAVERSASEDEIRKAFRKLSLVWHPDKAQQRGEDVERANVVFKELQAAYECLSDGHERAWYDAHREEILRGDAKDSESSDDDDDEDSRGGKKRPTRFKKTEVNLWPYFRASAYEGFSSSSRSFYVVFSEAFGKVEAAEVAENSDWPRASFGNAKSPWEDVKVFYDTYVDFQSRRSFGAYDKWKITSDLPRHVRRAAEADNKARRKNAKSEYQLMVRQLASYCRKRDPRVAAYVTQVQQEKQAQAQKAQEAKKQRELESLEARRLWRENNITNHEDPVYEVRTGTLLADLDDDDLRTKGRKKYKKKKGRQRHPEEEVTPPFPEDNDDDETLATEGGAEDDHDHETHPAEAGEITPPRQEALDDDDDDDDDDEHELLEPIAEEETHINIFSCDVCKKTFKSAKQLENHLQSKAHKKKAASSGKKR